MKWFTRGEIRFSELLEFKSKEVTQEFDKELLPFFNVMGEILDNNYLLMAEHFWLLDAGVLVQIHPKKEMLASAVGKNLFVLRTALDLTRQGLFGPARNLLRHVLEALVTAKYSAVSESNSSFERWKNGQSLSFSGLLNKVSKPDVVETKILWEVLCASSHASTVSQQVFVEWAHDEREIKVNLSIIRMLLECQYHLLNSHLLTPSIKQYALENCDGSKIKGARLRNRELFKKTRPLIGKAGSKVTREYCATWIVSP